MLGPHCSGLGDTGWPREPVRAPFHADPGFTCQDHSCTKRVGARLALPLAPAAASPCTVKGRSAGSGQEQAEECHWPSRAAGPGAMCPGSHWGHALSPCCPPSHSSVATGESQPRRAGQSPEPGGCLNWTPCTHQPKLDPQSRLHMGKLRQGAGPSTQYITNKGWRTTIKTSPAPPTQGAG